MMIDLWEYMGGSSPGSHLLLGVNGTSSYETCYSFVDNQGYTRFVKNGRHYETLWADDRYIYRGLDTSNILNNEVYAQFEGDRYGAVWSSRWVDSAGGDVCERDPMIRLYNANGGLLRSSPGGRSYLHFRGHFASLTFPETRRTLSDVVKLAWTFDPEGRNVIEDYYFGKREKLVGFDFYLNPPMHTRFGGYAAERPTFISLPNFNEPVPPPVRSVVVPPVPEVVIPDAPGAPVAMLVSAPNGLKHRPAPAASNKELRVMLNRTPVTVYPATATKLIDGEVWVFCKTAFYQPGWSAQRYLIPVPTLPAFRPTLPFDWEYLITGRMNDARSFGRHEGADFAPKAAHCGGGKFPIRAIFDGVVEDVRTWKEATTLGKLHDGYGMYVRVRHETDTGVYKSWYGHLAAPAVCEGDVVKAGDVVGVLGTSGNSTGEHLHLTIQHLGKGMTGYVVEDVIDPLPLFGLK